MLLTTDFQSAGRGQIGRSWSVAPGRNLTMSVILYPVRLPLDRQFLLNEMAALAVLDVLEQYKIKDVKVKWPNDVYVGDEKIAGILIQNQIQGRQLQSTVVGIGLNVNQRTWAADVPNPTSMANHLGWAQKKEGVLWALCTALEQRYLQVRNARYAQLEADYHRHLYLRDIGRRFYDSDGRSFQGKIIGVNQRGQLRVQTDSGGRVFDMGELSFFR